MLTGSCLCGAIAYEADAAARAHRPLPLPDLPQDAQLGLLVGDRGAAELFRWTRGSEQTRRVRILARQVPPLLHALRLAPDGRAGSAARRAAAAGLPRYARSPTGRRSISGGPDGASWYDPKTPFPELPEGLS